VVFQNSFAMTMEFVSALSGAWVLTNIYAPCSPEGRSKLLEWFHDIDYSDDCNWLVVGTLTLSRAQVAETDLVLICRACCNSMLP
jgi:hypothetical protein